MYSRPVIFVVISILVVTLVYNPILTFAVPNRSNDYVADCKPTGKQSENGLALVKCCWKHTEGFPRTTVTYCSTCEDGGTRGKINCTDPVKEFTGQIPSDVIPPQGGVLEQPETPPSSGGLPWLSEDIPTLEQTPQTVTPQEGEGEATEIPLATEETAPAAEEEEETVPTCLVGQVIDEESGICTFKSCPGLLVLDEETGLCVTEEQEEVIEEPQAEEPTEPQPNDEEQPSDEGDNSEDNRNN